MRLNGSLTSLTSFRWVFLLAMCWVGLAPKLQAQYVFDDLIAASVPCINNRMDSFLQAGESFSDTCMSNENLFIMVKERLGDRYTENDLPTDSASLLAWYDTHSMEWFGKINPDFMLDSTRIDLNGELLQYRLYGSTKNNNEIRKASALLLLADYHGYMVSVQGGANNEKVSYHDSLSFAVALPYRYLQFKRSSGDGGGFYFLILKYVLLPFFLLALFLLIWATLKSRKKMKT